MKTLVFLRHAKAEKNDLVQDFDRVLTDRGKAEASEMGKRLAKTNFKPDIIIASPAKRTHKTSKLIADELGYNTNKIDLNTGLYNVSFNDLIYLIRELSDDYNKVIIVGHNPATTSIIGYLTPTFVEHIPTAGYAMIKFDVKTWKMVNQSTGKLSTIDFPANAKSA